MTGGGGGCATNTTPPVPPKAYAIAFVFGSEDGGRKIAIPMT